MGILLITFYAMDSNEVWVNTKVELGNGILKAENQHMESVVGNEIQYWMEEGAAAQLKLSEKQRKKIEEKEEKRKSYLAGELHSRFCCFRSVEK